MKTVWTEEDDAHVTGLIFKTLQDPNLSRQLGGKPGFRINWLQWRYIQWASIGAVVVYAITTFWK